MKWPPPTVYRMGLTAVITGLLSGCTTIQKQPITAETVTMPSQWQTATVINAADEQHWLQRFDTPQLHLLVSEALDRNYTVRQAALLWQRAHKQSILSEKELEPTTTAKITANRSQTNSSGVSSHSSSHGLEISATWEPDLWNRLSDQQQATLVRENAAAADLMAARLSLVASLARNWFSAVEQQQQISLSEQRLRDYQYAKDIIEERYRNGITNALDLHLARSEVAIAEEQLTRQRLELKQKVRTVEVLLGRYPSAQLEIRDTLPALKESIPAGIPSALLERRPDIQSSRKRLEAAGLEADIATRNRLPSISLTAKGGTSSGDLHHLLDWNYLVWSLLGNLTQPLFQQEKLKTEASLKQLDQQQAMIEYAETVMNALQEVENGLDTDHSQKLRAEALARAANESQLAAKLALSSYRNGLVDILTLLDAQQRAYDRQSAHLSALAARIDNRVFLHLALGGDY